MADWQEEYKRKVITPEQAAGMVKSGDKVVFTAGREAFAIGMALAGRLGELQGVEVFVPSPGYDFGWYDPGWQESFKVTILMPTAVCQEAVDQHLVDINFGTIFPFSSLEDPDVRIPDFLITEISPPDKHGYCSFGQSLWNKKRHIKGAKSVIAEVNPNLIRTHGENFVHISEINHFVEHKVTGGMPGTGSLAGRELKEPEPFLKDIAANVSKIVRDGDTIQIGVGRTTEPLVRLGMLNGKKDLGYHSEATPSGIISLIRNGTINGSKKTLNPGLAVVTSLGGGTKDELDWANDNPLFRLVDVEYLEDMRVIAQNDNFVAINNALVLDFTGQIAAEGIGRRTLSVAGGQLPFVIGAWLSKGGRSITVVPSTAQNGQVSRIMPALPLGTAVTTQRNLADYVVTEWGAVRIRGKSVRQRAEALISIAHPKFREELTREARKLFWPAE